MRLYVEELRADPLVQVFTRTLPALVPYVRLHLCKYLSPAGTFTVTLTDADDNVLATSSQTLAEMQASGSAALAGNYYHGHVTFEFDTTLNLRPGDYKLKLSATDYTYADGTFIGWCKADTDRAIPITDDETVYGATAPYDFEIYALQRIR